MVSNAVILIYTHKYAGHISGLKSIFRDNFGNSCLEGKFEITKSNIYISSVCDLYDIE